MCPDLVQAWVSWAQFEKRAQQGSVGDHLQRCRSVLQQGLTLNPNNAKLCQVCRAQACHLLSACPALNEGTMPAYAGKSRHRHALQSL